MSKVLIATGGTGGHILPAQELAKELLEKNIEVLFAGGSLSSNRYFDRTAFTYKDVKTASPFRGNPFRALWTIIEGIKMSFQVLKDFKPDLVIGFGSFYSFPVLFATCLKKIPFVLFEHNAVPGKVNRFFSRWARVSALQFSQAAKKMKGASVQVKMAKKIQPHSKEEARDYFSLHRFRHTILVFGGSQGAGAINELFFEAISHLDREFQVIHFTGKKESADFFQKKYFERNISACVKGFEERMDLAWSAADMVVCRSGASTLAEAIAYEVPGILIPFPQAADDHQTVNAHFMEKIIGGAITMQESQLDAKELKKALEHLPLEKMKVAISAFKEKETKIDFCSLICDIIRG